MPTDAYRYVLSVDGRDIELADGEVTIGRSRTSTVRIDHESVSRSHALLTLERGQAVVKDLNSSNGTYVGGRRVLNETRLASGDRIQLGAAVIEYRLDAMARSERTALIDADMASAAPPPPEPAAVEASPAAPLSPATAGDEVEAPPSPPPAPYVAGDATIPGDSGPSPRGEATLPGEPGPPPPLEISAPDLGRTAREGEPQTPVAAHAALEAVRAKGEPPPPPPPELPRPLIRIPAPPRPGAVPPPPPPTAVAPAPSLASVPLRPSAPPRARSKASAPAPDLHSVPDPAGFGVRLLAQLVDGVVLTAVNIVLLSPVFLILFFRGELQPREAGPDAALLVVTALCALLMISANLWYVVGGWAKTGKTPGKSLMKIAVVAPGRPAGTGVGWRTAFVRLLGIAVSGMVFGIGYLMVLFRADRRALHDLIAGTSVVRTR